MKYFWVLSDGHTVREIDHKQFYKMAPWKGQKWRTLVATTRRNIRIVRAKKGVWKGIEVSIRQLKKILELLEECEISKEKASESDLSEAESYIQDAKEVLEEIKDGRL